jgi:hypothetical protein
MDPGGPLMTISSTRTRLVAPLRIRLLRAGVLAPLLASFAVVAGPGALPVAAANAVTVATSTSSQALQRPAQDKVAYLHDGSLLIAYYEPTSPGGVHVKQVKNPSTTPVATEVTFIGQGDAATIYTQQNATTTDIWIQVGNELFGGTRREQVQYGSYDGTTFTWSSVNLIPGGFTNGRQDPSVTWTGKWLIATWWDDTVGGNSDTIFMNWTADKTGASGWTMGKTGTTASLLASRNGSQAATTAAATRTGTTAAAIATATTIDYTVGTGGAPIVGDVFEFGAGATADVRAVTMVTGAGPYTLTVAALTNAHAAADPAHTVTQVTYTARAGNAPVAGDIYTFGAGLATAEGRTLDLVAGAGPYTLTVPALTNAHASGEIDTVTTWTIQYTAVSGGAPAVGDLYQISSGTNAEYRTLTAVSGSNISFAGLVNMHNSGETLTQQAVIIFTPVGSAIAQVSIRHSAKLQATIAVYGARSRLWTRTLLDSATNPNLGNWSAETAIDTFDDSEWGFGGPQIAIDETSGKIHVFRAVTTNGGPAWTGITYWLGTPAAVPMTSGSVTWGSRVVIDSTAGPNDPPDIAGAVDSTGTVYVFWTTSVTNGSIKYTTLVSPYTTFAPPLTVQTPAGSQPRYPHVPAQAPLTYGYVPLVYQTGTSSPFNIVLDTRYPPHPYVPVTPTRLLDTRTTGGPLAAGVTRNLTVAGGTLPVPLNATGVVVNVTVTNTSANSFLTVFPAGSSLPLASNLNWTPGKTIANLVEVPVGAGGAISMYNLAGSTDVVVDLEGYFVTGTTSTAGGEVALTPARITDTRAGSGYANAGSTLAAGATLDVQVRGVGGVPATGVSGAILNVTATNTTAASFLTVWPKNATRNTVSNLNWVAGQTVPNRVFVPIDMTTGMISIYNPSGSVDVIVDVGGYFTDATAAGNAFTPQSPTRIADTRTNATTLGPGGMLTLQITGVAGVPANAKAVILNVTVTNTTAPSFLTVYPSTATRPNASDLNWVTSQTVPNMVVATVGTTGAITFYNPTGSTDVIVDLFGYFT